MQLLKLRQPLQAGEIRYVIVVQIQHFQPLHVPQVDYLRIGQLPVGKVKFHRIYREHLPAYPDLYRRYSAAYPRKEFSRRACRRRQRRRCGRQERTSAGKGALRRSAAPHCLLYLVRRESHRLHSAD